MKGAEDTVQANPDKALAFDPSGLTLIGGGAFANPLELIWESIIWAFDEARPHSTRTFDVIVNGRNLGEGPQPGTILNDVRRRDGAVLRFNKDGLARVER